MSEPEESTLPSTPRSGGEDDGGPRDAEETEQSQAVPTCTNSEITESGAGNEQAAGCGKVQDQGKQDKAT